MKPRCFYFSLIFLFLTSCSNKALYQPNTINVPLLKEKGETKINIDQSGAQVAVAVSEHLGIVLNGFVRGKKTSEEIDAFGNPGRFDAQNLGIAGEIGTGYFKQLKHNFIFELYTGGGAFYIRQRGMVSPYGYGDYSRAFYTQGGKCFLQSSIAYSTRYFDLAFTPKVSFIKYTYFHSYNDPEVQYHLNGQLTNGIHVFTEPALTVRGGYKFIKLQLQLGLTLHTGVRLSEYDPFFANAGFVFDIAKWYNQ